jgi:hypothetical protein
MRPAKVIQDPLRSSPIVRILTCEYLWVMVLKISVSGSRPSMQETHVHGSSWGAGHLHHVVFSCVSSPQRYSLSQGICKQHKAGYSRLYMRSSLHDKNHKIWDSEVYDYERLCELVAKLGLESGLG